MIVIVMIMKIKLISVMIGPVQCAPAFTTSAAAIPLTLKPQESYRIQDQMRIKEIRGMQHVSRFDASVAAIP